MSQTQSVPPQLNSSSNDSEVALRAEIALPDRDKQGLCIKLILPI